MKRSFIPAALVAVLASAIHSQAAVILAVDFGTATSPLEDGFVRMSASASASDPVSSPFPAAVVASGEVTVSFAGAQSRLRTAPADSGAFTYGDLMADLFTQFANRTSTGTTFSLGGLDANTPYVVQLWALDRGFNDGAEHTFYETTDGASNLLGTVINSTSATPADNDDFSIVATVTSNAVGEVHFGHTASVGSGTLNALRISEIPEPTSMALFGAGGLLFLLKRRRS